MVYAGPIQHQPQVPDPRVIKKLILISTIAAGVQFGWALQLSLLTPYTQLLGLSHQFVSFIWLCGPISGLIIQPAVGYYSDRCTSRFGRRRPFIVSGIGLLLVGILLIGFAADIGHNLGDSLTERVKHRAVAIFVIGFWFLDISNNMIQGPCRALLADISGDDVAMVTIGNALFAFFMAVGNILGFAASASENIYHIFPFTSTEVCGHSCANLKTCFLLSIILSTFIVTMVIVFIKEEQHDPSSLNYWRESFHEDEKPPSFLMQIVIATKSTPKPIWILYLVTALNWIGRFPFVLYDTDWMGKEIYGGKVVGNSTELKLYGEGVRAGSVGLILYVVTMGVVSLFMEPLVRILGNVRRLWSSCNFLLALCMGFTVIVSKMADKARGNSLVPPPLEVKVSCFAVFALLGIPQAVTYCIPFALASIYSKDSRTGQGLALGLLNLAIVIPQMGVALISGPLDSIFGGSNLPAFVWGGITAAIGGIAALQLPLDDSQSQN